MGQCLEPCRGGSRDQRTPRWLSEYRLSLNLLELEDNAAAAGLDEPINTVTFFKGASAGQAAASVKERLRKVLASNPWVAGRLIYSSDQKRMQLLYPPAENATANDIVDDIVRVDPSGLSISPTTPYDDLVENIVGSPAVLKKLNVSSVDLSTRITFTSHPTDANAFAMVFQMSHVIADGATYYMILNMISSAGSISAMTVERKEEATPKMKEAQGLDDYAYMMSKSFMVAAVKGVVFGRKAKCVCRYIDEDRMKEAKAEAKKESDNDNVKFVSSNDVLVSTMAKVTDARLFGEAIQFRGKVGGLDACDAGNYESLLWLDKEVYARPAKLRKMMTDGPPYKGRGYPLPGTWESLNANFGVMTNWAGFSGPLVFGGCEAELHLPLVPLGVIPFENACVFRPNKDKLAVMYFTKRFEAEDFIQGCPLGGPVSKEIFG